MLASMMNWLYKVPNEKLIFNIRGLFAERARNSNSNSFIPVNFFYKHVKYYPISPQLGDGFSVSFTRSVSLGTNSNLDIFDCLVPALDVILDQLLGHFQNTLSQGAHCTPDAVHTFIRPTFESGQRAHSFVQFVR